MLSQECTDFSSLHASHTLTEKSSPDSERWQTAQQLREALLLSGLFRDSKLQILRMPHRTTYSSLLFGTSETTQGTSTVNAFVDISKILLYWSILEDIQGQFSVNNDTDTTEICGHQLLTAAHDEHMVNTEFKVFALLCLREVKSLPRDGEQHLEFHLTTEKCLTVERP